MAIGNQEPVQECFPKYSLVGAARMKEDKVTDEGKKREMIMEIKVAMKEKKCSDGLDHPNHNTIIIVVVVVV